MTTEREVEQEIKDKGLTAPRLTPELVDRKIESTQYYIFPGSMLTVCCLTLINGFNVIGSSACASPENFNKELGEKISFRNARNEIWALEGYLLKQTLSEQSETI